LVDLVDLELDVLKLLGEVYVEDGARGVRRYLGYKKIGFSE
jgi:hypothetical protein